MLELGQPTHPYDLALLPGRGLSVRRARPGETVETLDGVERTVGRAGAEPRRHRRGLPHLRRRGHAGRHRRDHGRRVVGDLRRHDRGAARGGLLHADGHRPHLQAPGSAHRGLGALRARRRPVGDRAVGAPLLPAAGRERARVSAWPTACSTSAGDVPEPFVVSVPIARVHSQIGVALGREEIARLIEPIGFTVLEHGGAAGRRRRRRRVTVTVIVPTNRPDVRPEPYGVDDVIEEIARMFGYSNVPRRVPTWPQPGGLTPLQRSRRAVKDVLCGLGASEGWTDTFVSAAGARRRRPDGPGRAGGQPARRREAVPAPLPHAGPARRAGLQRQPPPARRAAVRGGRRLLPSRRGRAAGRRARAAPAGPRRRELPGERELLSAVFARDDDDARAAVAAWHVLADALRLDGVRLVPPGDGTAAAAGPAPDPLGAPRRARRQVPGRSSSARSGRSTPPSPPRSG